MAFIVSGDLAQQLVSLYASAALPATHNVFAMGSIVNRNYESTGFSTMGQYVNVPLPPSMTANSLSEGGGVVQQENQLTTVQIPINQHFEASFAIPQATSTLTNLDLMRTYLQPAIIAVCTAVENSLLGLASGLTTNAAVGAAATTITPGVIRDARKALVKAQVPANVPKYLIVNPDSYEAILADASMTAQYSTGDSALPIQTGNIGTRYGFNIIEHQGVKQTSAGSPAVITTQNLALAGDSMALVTRTLPSIMPGLGATSAILDFGTYALRLVYSYANLQLAEQWTVSCMFGNQILRNNFGVIVKS